MDPDDEQHDHAVARAGELLDVGRHEQALVEVQTALTRWPDSAKLLMLAAVALRSAHRLDDAIAAGEDAVASAPDEAEPHATLGELLSHRDRDRARSTLQRAAELDPMWAYPRVMLSHDHAARHEYTDAEQNALRAIELEPDYPYAYNALGIALRRRRPVEARAAFLKALELDPNDPKFAHNVALLDRRRSPHAAVRHLAAALSSSPQYEDGRQALDYVLAGRVRAAFWRTTLATAILTLITFFGPVAHLVLTGLLLLAVALHLRSTAQQIRSSMPGGGVPYLRSFVRREPIVIALAVVVVAIWAWLIGVSLANLDQSAEAMSGPGLPVSGYALIGVGLGLVLIVAYRVRYYRLAKKDRL